jgi:hypothetical protein
MLQQEALVGTYAVPVPSLCGTRDPMDTALFSSYGGRLQGHINSTLTPFGVLDDTAMRPPS